MEGRKKRIKKKESRHTRPLHVAAKIVIPFDVTTCWLSAAAAVYLLLHRRGYNVVYVSPASDDMMAAAALRGMTLPFDVSHFFFLGGGGDWRVKSLKYESGFFSILSVGHLAIVTVLCSCVLLCVIDKRRRARIYKLKRCESRRVYS